MQTKKVIIEYGEIKLALKVIKDLEVLVDDPTDEDQIPCWAEIWPAARALGKYIAEDIEVTNRSVLELGAGMGLPGMVAAKKGAKVVLTDYQPKALDLANQNIQRNQLTEIITQFADWRNFPLSEKYNIIIASDVLYDPKYFEYLWSIMDDNLAKGGLILASHPGRKDTFEFIEELKKRIPLEEVVHTINIEIDDPLFPHYKIRIHHLNRK